MAKQKFTGVTVTIKRTRREVPKPKNGRPSYAWVTGYIVVSPLSGCEIHPAVGRAEAIDLARSLGGNKFVFV